jgi:glycerophosphoryl diester phosphodiesterase
MAGILDEIYGNRTLVFGHRGASGYAPMNTLPAFELAAEQGADGIELDVWLPADGDQLVILHDVTVDHTTNGTGSILTRTLQECKALDASYRFPEYRGVQIPTLDEVFEAVGHKLIVNVEIKADPAMRPETAAAVAACIRRWSMERRVIVSSFSAVVLRGFQEVMPEVPIGFLYAEDTPESEWELVQNFSYQAIHPHHTLIDEALMADAFEDGHLVNTWTVNDTNRALDLVSLGVRGLITDTPDVILKALGRERADG